MERKTPPTYEQHPRDYSVEAYSPTRMPWEHMGPIIMNIVRDGFPPLVSYDRFLRKHLADTRTTAALLKYSPEHTYIGISYAQPVGVVYKDRDMYPNRPIYPRTAYITATILRTQYQGRHLVRPLMETLESYLKHRGYTHIERDSLIQNGYAAAIERWYGDRIETKESFLHASPFGPQKFFRIAL